MTADPSFESAHLLARCTAGDSAAEAQLFERYVVRLTLLARSRLSRRLAARVDPEDIVLSAYRSFFLAARDHRFELQRTGDLWRLLVKVTLRKVYDQAAFHQAGKRDLRREVSPAVPSDGEPGAWLEIMARDPSPEEVTGALEVVEQLLRELPEPGPQILQLRLQGFRQDEIAAQVGCAERTVRRWLERAGELLRSQHQEPETRA